MATVSTGRFEAGPRWKKIELRELGSRMTLDLSTLYTATGTFKLADLPASTARVLPAERFRLHHEMDFA